MCKNTKGCVVREGEGLSKTREGDGEVYEAIKRA